MTPSEMVDLDADKEEKEVDAIENWIRIWLERIKACPAPVPIGTSKPGEAQPGQEEEEEEDDDFSDAFDEESMEMEYYQS